MEMKEKIREIYKKYNINIDEKRLKTITQDKERTKRLIKFYEKIIKDFESEVNV